MEVDMRSRELLMCLRENSRQKLTVISRKTQIPVTTLFTSLKELQGTAIKRSTVLLDFHELGYQTRAHVFLKVTANEREEVRKFLLHKNEINSLYRVSDEWDFILETVHKNNRELTKFIDSIEHTFRVERKKIHYVVEELKREQFLLTPYDS